jgi:hypothetical protein
LIVKSRLGPIESSVTVTGVEVASAPLVVTESVGGTAGQHETVVANVLSCSVTAPSVFPAAGPFNVTVPVRSTANAGRTIVQKQTGG